MEYIFLGLGNPGKQYKGTVHNIGQDFIEGLVAAYEEGWQEFSGYKLATIVLGGHTVLCAVTKGYMNETGESLAELLQYIEPSRLIVFHDDTAFSPGQIRLSQGKDDGGHNGIASITKVLGTNDFLRLRIGVGRKLPLHTYVLELLSPAEREKIATVLEERIPAVLADLLHIDTAAAMKQCNT